MMENIFYKDVKDRTYAAPQYGKEIILRVGKDIEEKGTAAISKEAMSELGISEGDHIEIIGAWTQNAKIILLTGETINTIHLNKATRLALPVAVGQEAAIRKDTAID